MMRPRAATRAVALGALGLALALGSTACSGGSNGTPSGGVPSAAGVTTAVDANPAAGVLGTGRAGDVMFAQMLVAHHTQGLVMADLALAGYGDSMAVREVAATMKASEEPVLRQAQQWLREWQSAPLASDHPGHKEPGMMSAPALAALADARGNDFDLTWARMMQSHGEGAITLAKYLLKTSTTPEVKAVATTLIETKQAEVLRLKAIR